MSGSLDLQLSATGRVACDGAFLDVFGQRPSANIQCPTATSSPLSSWSAFAVPRAIRRESAMSDQTRMHEAGEHVALAFDVPGGLFFSVGVFRCDTWALQWAVRAEPDTRVTSLCSLSAHTIAFVAECPVASGDSTHSKNRKDSGTAEGPTRTHPKLFVAQRKDIPRVARHENRACRSFLADAHSVPLECEAVRDMCAASASTVLLLTTTGALVRVSTESPFSAEELLPAGSFSSAPGARLVLSNPSEDSEAQRFVAVFVPGEESVHVAELRTCTAHEARPATRAVSLPESVRRVDFAGPHVMVAMGASLHFACLVPAADESFSVVSLPPVSLPSRRVPVATHYCASSESHVVLAANACGVETVEVSMENGPYGSDALCSAIWRPLTSRNYTFAAHTKELADSADLETDAAEAEEINDGALGDSVPAQKWEPITLHYAIATTTTTTTTTSTTNATVTSTTATTSSHDVSVAVLRIETAPFLHSRLAQQSHNAARGLWALLSTPNTFITGLPPFAVAWNPRHMRRALRFASQAGLCALFTAIATALRESPCPLYYGAACVASVDAALQIVTLSRQVGARLETRDVETIALLLRASRETGHRVMNFTARCQLLLNYAARRAVLTRAQHDDPDKKEEEQEEDEKEKEAKERNEAIRIGMGIGTAPQAEARLATRYAPNVWVRLLSTRREAHERAVAAAAEYLSGVAHLTAGANGNEGAAIADWATLGRKPHADAAFTEYESAIVQLETETK